MFDYGSNTYNSSVTAGYFAGIRGSNFRVDTGNAGHGIYFVNDKTGEEVKVTVISRCTVSTIIFRVPLLDTGARYRIMLRCGFASNMSETSFRTEINVNRFNNN